MATTTISSTSSLPRWLTPWATPRPQSPFVSETDVTAVTSPVHANQRVEKSFTITKSDDDNATGLHQVQVYAPGLTVIRVEPQLLNDVGPDVVARVRVSSDEREHIERMRVTRSDKCDLEIQYKPKRGTVGHLVTEIDVARPDDVRQVVAMCRGDVVVTDDVLARRRGPPTDANAVATALPIDSTGLISVFGARLVLASLDRERVEFDDLLLGCFGSGRVDVTTPHLVVANELSSIALGRGAITLHTHAFQSTIASLGALGGGSVSVTATGAFSTRHVNAYQRGNGAVRITAPMANACLIQAIGAGGGGVVDVADVPSNDTAVGVLRPLGAVVRIQAPRTRLAIEGSAGGAIHHVGALPSRVELKNTKAPELIELEPDSLAVVRQDAQDTAVAIPIPISIPTIASAFETPVSLEKPSEGWFLPIALPTLRSLIPY